MADTDALETIALPIPTETGSQSVEVTLRRRRSVRDYSDEPLSRAQISQLAWATQGITHSRGFRAAPSAGALYPLELYVVLETGAYRYEPEKHRLRQVQTGDLRPALRDAALGQDAVAQAPVVFVLTGRYERTAKEYGDVRARRYVHFEAGHAAQNFHLQGTALGLGTLPVGAFDDERVRHVLRLSSSESPLYLLTVGHPRS